MEKPPVRRSGCWSRPDPWVFPKRTSFQISHSRERMMNRFVDIDITFYKYKNNIDIMNHNIKKYRNMIYV